jgi:hypothetical protein
MNMQFKILILVLFISIKGHCQFMSLSKYDTGKNRETDNAVIYKIKGKKYETDHKTFFSSENKMIYKKSTDNIISFVIYDKRFLFVGYYPNTQEQRMMAIPYEVRALGKLEVIDLEDASKKWTYQFEENAPMGNIKSFNPENGDIIYCNHIKPEKSNQ